MRRLSLSVGLAVALVLPPAAASASFGFEEVDLALTGPDGGLAMQAGAHPFALTTSLRVNTVEESGLESPDGDLGELWIEFPPGLVAAPSAVPACAEADFLLIEDGENDCSDSSAVGVGEVTASSSGPIPVGTEDFLEAVPVYRLSSDEALARIGFVAAGQPFIAELGLTETEPYGGYLASTLPESVLFYSARLTIWGVPADPAHDADRGACAFLAGSSCPVAVPAKPLLTTPRSCSGPLEMLFEASSRQDPEEWVSAGALTHDNAEPPSPLGLSGCSQLAFSPAFTAQPTTDLAATASGLDLDLAVVDEGLVDPSGLAQSEIKTGVVALPEGTTLDPDLLAGPNCTPDQYAQESLESEPGEGCPPASELGTIEVETPLLDGEIFEGSVFAAQPDDPGTIEPGAENPFDSLFAVYVVVKHSGLGTLVKQAGEVAIEDGQLLAGFDELPQLPISDLRLRLDANEHGPLVTPDECGEFIAEAFFVPWSSPGDLWKATDSFEIAAGAGGGPCPSDEPPPEEPTEDGLGPPAVSALIPPAASPPPGPSTRPRRKARRCPKGKRRIGKGRKARCVRKRGATRH